MQQFHFVEQRVGANHVGIALVELTVATFLWSVGTPYRLNLEAAERELQFVAVLYHKACERHGKVVAQTLLANLCSQTRAIFGFDKLMIHSAQKVA